MTDPRIDRTKKHNLFEVLVLTVLAFVAGADTWTDVERFGRAKLGLLRQFLELKNGVPSHDTIGRIFALLDPAALTRCIIDWMKQLGEQTKGRLIAIDGKTLRRSHNKASGRSALHLVSAWSADNRVVLGQIAVEDKSNEITAIPELLELIDVKGAVVTIDAMGCQKAIASKIRDKGGDYVLAVKGNQESLHDAVRDAFIEHGEREFRGGGCRQHVTAEGSHGRDEKRQVVIAPVPPAVARLGWRGVRSIGMVVSTRTVAGETSTEIRYYITTLPAKVKAFAHAVRGHWSIETQLLVPRCNFFRRPVAGA